MPCLKNFTQSHTEYMYTGVEGILSLQILKVVFSKKELKFVFKLLNNIIDYPELLELINFKIDKIGSCDKSLFYLKNITKNYLLNLCRY